MKSFIASVFAVICCLFGTASAADFGSVRPGASYQFSAVGTQAVPSVDTIELDVVAGWTYNVALYGQHTCAPQGYRKPCAWINAYMGSVKLYDSAGTLVKDLTGNALVAGAPYVDPSSFGAFTADADGHYVLQVTEYGALGGKFQLNYYQEIPTPPVNCEWQGPTPPPGCTP